MIVLDSKDRDSQAPNQETASQELAAEVAIPKITPYAQTAVQADFGTGSKPKALEAEYTGPNYLGQLGRLLGLQLGIGAAMIGSVWLLSLFI